MELPDYKNFTVKKTDLDRIVKGELMSFCMNKKLTKTLYEGTVQSFDYVNLAFNGKIDGQTFEGGVSDDYDLLIGSGSFIEGFEDGMIGMEVGQTRDLFLKFPENYYKEFAGKDVVFTVTVRSITRMDELTDEICKSNSIYDTKEAFMKALTEVCLFDYEWQTLMSKCTLKGYPKEYTEYYQYFYGYFESEAQASQMELEAFLSVYGGYYSSYGLWRGMKLADFNKLCEDYARSSLF
jgi:trigger factor